MRKALVYLFSILCLTLVSSCTDEITDTETAFSVSAVVSGPDGDTKVAYDYTTDPSRVIPSWEKGDTVFGWDDSGATFSFIVESVTDGIAKLNAGGYVPGKATKLYAVYYPGKSAADLEGSGATRTLAVDLSAQDGALSSTAPVLMCATAAIDGSSAFLKFTNRTAIIGIRKFKVDPGTVVKGFTINGVKTAGRFEVVDGSLSLSVTGNASRISTATALNWTADGEGVVDKDLWFAALPDGKAVLSLDVTTDDGVYSNFVSIPSVDLQAGHCYSMTKVMGGPGTNVFGYVRCDGNPVAGVVVTDGYEFTRTDSDGMYRLNSNKEYGFVEISIPSGYRVPSQGVIPQFFAKITKGVDAVEQHDFTLVRDAEQTQHTMLFFTDPHLSKEYNDIATFKTFEADVNDYITTHPSENIFAATGGDMSFDKKWYRHNYLPANYVAEENSAFKSSGLQIFHCIGNHDHEIGKKGAYTVGEKACAQKYKDAFGPTFYSYNIGQAHYICIDNIYCTNDGSGTASYKSSIEPYILEWMKKDLTYVDASKVIFLQMHAPLFNAAGNKSLANADNLIAALSGRKTYILSGHSHRLYTIDKMDELGILELNAGSVCGTWWITSYYYPGIIINREGTPGGYHIIKVDGTNVSWQFKAYGRDINEQFRTYDINSIHITPEKYCPAMPASLQEEFNTCMWKFTTDWQNNRFFVHVYNYDPKWTVEVYEGDKPLNVSAYKMYDPLHMIAYEAVALNKGNVPTSSLRAQNNYHVFLVTPASRTSTLEIKVTDRFGRVYSKSVNRPQPFSIEEYK